MDKFQMSFKFPYKDVIFPWALYYMIYCPGSATATWFATDLMRRDVPFIEPT